MPVFKTGAINHSATSPAEHRGTDWLKSNQEVSLHQSIPFSFSCELERLGMKFHDLVEVGQKIREAVIAGVGVVFVRYMLF